MVLRFVTEYHKFQLVVKGDNSNRTDVLKLFIDVLIYFSHCIITTLE